VVRALGVQIANAEAFPETPSTASTALPSRPRGSGSAERLSPFLRLMPPGTGQQSCVLEAEGGHQEKVLPRGCFQTLKASACRVGEAFPRMGMASPPLEPGAAGKVRPSSCWWS